jgi:hypothetical protein
MANAHAKSKGRSTDHGSRIATARLVCHTRVGGEICRLSACQLPALRAAPSESHPDVVLSALIADTTHGVPLRVVSRSRVSMTQDGYLGRRSRESRVAAALEGVDPMASGESVGESVGPETGTTGDARPGQVADGDESSRRSRSTANESIYRTKDPVGIRLH